MFCVYSFVYCYITHGIISSIIALLNISQEDFMGGKLNFFEEKFKNHDDVHMNMEARLIDKLGMDVGGRMHTTRSRNDQVSWNKYFL